SITGTILRASRLFENPVPTEPSARPVDLLTVIGLPLRNAPPPRRAEKHSLADGSWMTPTTVRLSCTQAIATHQAGMPRTKFAVPSIGSITQTKPERP